MAAKQLQDHAAARRERNTDGNQIGADAVASGMAAAGLGLALLHQDLQSAEAATAERLRSDGAHDVAPPHVESQQQHVEAQQAGAESSADRSESDQPVAASAIAPDETAHTGAAQHEFGNDEHSDVSTAPETQSSLDGPVTASQSTTGSTATSSGAGSASVQDTLSDASSSLSTMTTSFQQQISETASSVAHSVDSIVSGVTDSLASLTTQLSSSLSPHALGDVVQSSVQAPLAHAADALEGISDTLLGAVPAPVQIDPIFQGVFGPANGSSASQFAHDVVDTGGLASFGDVTHGLDLGFLGQSYTELADHTLTGTPGMGHGLI